MIERELDAIADSDIQLLVDDGVRERQNLEYKRDLPGGSDLDRREFLADVSAFANTVGGDLIFGIDEDQGIPTQICGAQSPDFDLEIRRLENLIRDGLEPRISFRTRLVPIGSVKILLIRIDRSWSGPHRVIFRGHDKFYGRNSAGKYPLNTEELRRAFLGSSARIDRIRNWRVDRVLTLSRNETPISPFAEGGKLVLHCIPLSSFDEGIRYDVLKYGRSGRLFPMQSPMSFYNTLNFEGALAHDARDPHQFYTQLYRNGTIEAVDAYILARMSNEDDRRYLPSHAYERVLIDYLPKCLEIIGELGAKPPILVAVSMLGVRGLQMGVERSFSNPPPLDRDSLLVPEFLVESPKEPADVLLRGSFDMIWNAFGYERSGNYDSNGRFNRK